MKKDKINFNNALLFKTQFYKTPSMGKITINPDHEKEIFNIITFDKNGREIRDQYDPNKYHIEQMVYQIRNKASKEFIPLIPPSLKISEINPKDHVFVIDELKNLEFIRHTTIPRIQDGYNRNIVYCYYDNPNGYRFFYTKRDLSDNTFYRHDFDKGMPLCQCLSQFSHVLTNELLSLW